MAGLLSDIDPVEFVPVASVHDGGVPQTCMADSQCAYHHVCSIECAYTVWNVM